MVVDILFGFIFAYVMILAGGWLAAFAVFLIDPNDDDWYFVFVTSTTWPYILVTKMPSFVSAIYSKIKTGA